MTPTENKKPCRFCLNAYSDPEGELTPDNDLSYSTIGFSVRGHRLMLGCGRCQLDGSRRGSCCWSNCPNCKPKLKDRMKAAWHILTWNRRWIR